MNEGDWSVSEMCAADRLYGKYLTACEERYVRSTERLEGASSILSMLEDKADGDPVTASEIAAIAAHSGELRRRLGCGLGGV